MGGSPRSAGSVRVRSGSPVFGASPPEANAAPSSASLRTYALAAAASLAYGGAPPATDTGEARFLLDQLALVSPDGSRWATTLASYVRRPEEADAPLIGLAGELGLTVIEMLAVALAAAVEDDAMVGRALAHLQAPVGGSRPTLGLLAAAFAPTVPPSETPLDALAAGAAVRSGLLQVLNEGAPMPERAVSVPRPLCLALRGRDGTWPGVSLGLGDLPEVLLPASIVTEAERHAQGLAVAPRRALVIRSGSMLEGRSVAAVLAAAMRRRPVFLDGDCPNGLGPWLALRQLVPAFCFELGPGERKALPSIPCYTGPALVLCGPDGSVAVASGSALSWSLPVPPQAERRALWEAALGAGALADELACHHRHGSGRIAQLGRLVQHRASLRGEASPNRSDVTAASWVGEGSGLDSLAQPLPDSIPDEALVLAPGLRHELDVLLMRCRARDTLIEGLGASAVARYRPGVRALFVGPSGTGKTLAAGWLATQLGLPLYRVDLASVTSKYIGETEKNLAQLLARAEQAEVVLLFDEADSLFGKRTEIREANDRFANAQTNYLLQRIESFDGITLLTSNSRIRFDSAFTRRLDAIIEFPLPGPEERRALWHSHLGAAHGLSPREINQLAATVDLGGGHIRNAVLAAAVQARAEGRAIAACDVVEGLAGEYRKLGRQLPVELARR